ncbi:hypothetical protein BDS110ZK18_22650 [Bradyrhizobium diazoefficiens]|uniref:Uncharacterized protein n=1 Tax=Bradyrhizobium diazoefficiens TaxID=1355477 RepID=A0A809Y2T4_9BRAD|nr:hypothetical protein XF2B_78480 [Bradyrhizobium diazoefficiens]BCF21157.1 hypothetical protein XF13B_78480 [Bradyrhizobium diazoefficiens]
MRSGITPVRFRHYLDTVAYFFPMKRLPRADWASICKLYGDTPHTSRNAMGMLVAFQCPQPDVLEKIAALCDQFHGNLTRYDISSDAIGSAAENLAFIKEHLLLKRRKAMPIKTFDNIGGEGSIYCPFDAPRNVALYGDFPSKLEPDGPNVAKIDLRLRSRAKCGINHYGLIGLNPMLVILRNIRFVEFDRQRFERRTYRNVTKEEADLEQAIARIRDMKRHYQFDFVQRVHDYAPHLQLVTDNDLVRLENKLSWNAVRRNAGKKDLSNEINMIG